VIPGGRWPKKVENDKNDENNEGDENDGTDADDEADADRIARGHTEQGRPRHRER